MDLKSFWKANKEKLAVGVTIGLVIYIITLCLPSLGKFLISFLFYPMSTPTIFTLTTLVMFITYIIILKRRIRVLRIAKDSFKKQLDETKTNKPPTEKLSEIEEKILQLLSLKSGVRLRLSDFKKNLPEVAPDELKYYLEELHREYYIKEVLGSGYEPESSYELDHSGRKYLVLNKLIIKNT